MTDELYNKLVCALTHNLSTCDECKKCQGSSYAEIRLNLIKELAKEINKELPYEETKSDK